MIDRPLHYVLEGHEPVPVNDILEWGKKFEEQDQRVNVTEAHLSMQNGEKNLGNITISTVFLGIDHAFGDGPPLLFETMVFGGPLDQEQERCSTWEGAEKMHEKMVERVKLAVKELNDD